MDKKSKFYEKLKDPNMAYVKEGVIALINNPKNTIGNVAYSQFNLETKEVTLTVEIIVPDSDE